MSELKTHAEIIAEMRGADNKCQLATKDGTGCYHCPFGSAASNCVFDNYADRLDAAHKREVDALKQRLAELNAEIAAKDAVIMRLNDALAEEQRRKMATTEKSSVVGDAAKLPKTVDLRFDICRNIELVLKIGRDYQNKDGYRGAHYDTVKLLCDAIEYQQEQLKTKTKVGDAAKLREAIEAVLLAFNYGESTIVNQLPFSKLLPMLRKCVEALAAPPRNCDIYLTEEAVDAATMTVRDCKACSRIDMEAPCVFCMVRWLLAPAKEGGAK